MASPSDPRLFCSNERMTSLWQNFACSPTAGTQNFLTCLILIKFFQPLQTGKVGYCPAVTSAAT